MFWQEMSKMYYAMKYATKLSPKKSTAVWLETIQKKVKHVMDVQYKKDRE